MTHHLLPKFVIGSILVAIMAMGCTDTHSDYEVETDYSRLDMQSAPSPMVDMGSSDRVESGSDPVEAAPSYLAYRYDYAFSLPNSAVRSVAQSHVQLCLDAGPALCQLLSSSVNEYDADNVSANIRLRAAPGWLDDYTDTIKADIDDHDGALTSSNVSAEDLTRQILDVDARLSAQTTLRDRLSTLLETRNAELSDLLALERELARVQGEIESVTSTLKALRQRVDMSVVTLNYQSRARAVSSSAFSPIGRALKNFVRTLSNGLAGVIMFLATILPWLIFVILPGLWVIRWALRRRNKQVIIRGGEDKA